MLRLNRLTDYATVVLTVLAVCGGGRLSAVEVAQRAGLETPTASKVLKLLARANLVASFRGASGGYQLVRPAEEISVAEIVRAIEGPVAMTDCSIGETQCAQVQNCSMRPNWVRVSEAVEAAIEKIKLSDMLPEASPEADEISVNVESD